MIALAGSPDIRGGVGQFWVFGARPIREIAVRDIKQVAQAIDRQGAGETAGRVFQRMRSIYRYALSENLVETDPTYPLKPSEIFKPREATDRLALAEADMPTFLGRLDSCEGDPSTTHESRARSIGSHGGPAWRTARRSVEGDRRLPVTVANSRRAPEDGGRAPGSAVCTADGTLALPGRLWSVLLLVALARWRAPVPNGTSTCFRH